MKSELAIDGGEPVRRTLLPYGRQCIDEADIAAVVQVLRSDYLTTGPAVPAFEQAFARFVGQEHAVAVSSGTAALHAAVRAAGIQPGDEVVVPPMTFVATANAVVFEGGVPVFADVDPDTLLLDPTEVERRITSRTRAIIAVDYAGQPCDYEALQSIARRHGLTLIADACHSLGADSAGRPVGGLADLSVFSFHPVKAITTGEGGMVTTADPVLAERLRRFRTHCMNRDAQARARQVQDAWAYDIEGLGHNYRLGDIQCALGQSQLAKLPGWIARRQEIAALYDAALLDLPGITPLTRRRGCTHAYHLYVIQLDPAVLQAGRQRVFAALRAEGIGVNVHYIPVTHHSFYRRRFRTAPGDCPVADAAYERIITIPLFPDMTRQDVADVIAALEKVVRAYAASPQLTLTAGMRQGL